MLTAREAPPRGAEGEVQPRGGVLGTPALVALIWLVAASGTLLLLWGSKLTFLLDDWEFLLYRRGFNAHAILDPHGEHISVVPVLIYKALLATFGMGSALPFRVVSTALFLLSCVLLFVFLRRRIGDWLALVGIALVLFLGAGFEDLLWSFQVGYFGSMAAGLGALLALERDERGGDALACGLLVVSILFSSLGLPFLIGVFVLVLLREDRWRRIYVVVVPAVVYAVWWLGWGHTAESAASLSNLARTPAFVANGVAASFASACGLALPSAGNLEWGRPLAVAGVLLALWRLSRARRVPPWFWALLAIGASFWILAGVNQEAGRDPTSSRYQYVGVVFALLVAAELLRGVRLGRGWLAVVAVIAAGAVAGNLHYLHQAYLSYRVTSQLEKADLGAVELARSTVEPGFVLSEDLADTAYVHVEAGPYLSARDAFGSPAYDPSELAEAPSNARYAADKVLFGALRLAVVDAPSSALPRSRPELANGGGLFSVPARGCLRVDSKGTASPLLSLPPGGAIFGAGAAPIEDIRLARFSEGEFPIDFQRQLAPGRVAKLEIPADGSPVRWRLQLETAGTATVCGLSS
ncbi:MAG TPA: hypothetical protein VFN82_03115 [Solirubrobacterales bacterium]|nr:hypothetical protein [Solirubrobacterales bacterium]